MATRQFFNISTFAGIGSGNLFLSPTSPTETWSGAIGVIGQPWLTDAYARHLGITRFAGIGTGITVTYAIYINGLVTPFTVSMTGTDTTASITGCLKIDVGDRITLKRTVTGGNCPAGTDYITFVIDNQVANETGYGFQDITNLFTGVERCPVFGGDAFDSYLVPAAKNLVSVPGNITDLKVHAVSVLPMGVSQVFYFVKNGVAQNGSGGTPDTRVTLDNSNAFDSWNGTLAVVAGDQIYLETSQSGGSPGNISFGVGIKFAPTTDGHSWCGSSRDNYLPQVAGTVYGRPMSMTDDSWAAVETNDTVFNTSPFSFDIKGIRWSITPIFGSPSSMTWSVRVNGASPSGTPSATGTTSGADTTSQITIDPGNYWDIRVVQTGTAGIGTIGTWSFIQIASSDVGACGVIPPGTGTIRVTKVTSPSTSDTDFPFTASGMTPTDFVLSNNEVQLFEGLDPLGGPYAIDEDVPDGWEVEYSIDPTDIPVVADEITDVVVTNTVIQLTGSGIYYIHPGKRNDTIYTDVAAEDTEVVKIPNPTYKTALIGD